VNFHITQRRFAGIDQTVGIGIDPGPRGGIPDAIGCMASSQDVMNGGEKHQSYGEHSN
jgi:hypothetical protein